MQAENYLYVRKWLFSDVIGQGEQRPILTQLRTSMAEWEHVR